MQRQESAIYIGLLILSWLGQPPHTWQGWAKGNDSTLVLLRLHASHEISQVLLEKHNQKV